MSKQMVRFLVILFFAVVMAWGLLATGGKGRWFLSAILSFFIFVLALAER